MERGRKNNTLPEDLVEMIVARVPFPWILKARFLSKSWLARFKPISSLDDDEEKKHLATSFQKRVAEFSDNWETYCPFCHACTPNVDPNREQVLRHDPLIVADGEQEFEVEAIVNHRTRTRSMRIEYFVQWKGYDESDNTWEPEWNMVNAPDIVRDYRRRVNLD